MGSRVLGLVREQVFAAFLGAGSYADAFLVAFRIPNLLRDLFAEGALSAAFVPTYTREMKEGGQERAHQLASRLLSILAVVLAVVILLGLVFTRPLVEFLAPGFDPSKMDLAIFLTRIMLPFLPLVSFAAVAMGMLNAQGRFGIPAAAPVMFNVVSIVWAAGLWAMGFGPEQVVIGWAIGTVLGGAAQLLIQVPPLWREGWRYRPEWKPGDPGIRAIGRLMAPATVGLAAVEVNILVNTIFASHEDGAVAWLGYAFRILYLPIGIFGVAVGTVTTTGLVAAGRRRRHRRPAPDPATRPGRGRVPEHARDRRPRRAAHPDRAAALRARAVRRLRHRAHRHRARAVLDRPRRLHGSEGPRPRVLRDRPSPRAAAGQRVRGGDQPAW